MEHNITLDDKKIADFKAAVLAIRGARDECETIAEYMERLIQTYELSPEAAAEALPQYLNIIEDEMNHGLRFMLNVFVPLTGIQPDMDGLEEESE